MAPVGAEGGVVNAAEGDVSLLQRIRAAYAAAVGDPTWDRMLGMARAQEKGYALRDGLLVRSRGEGQGHTLVIPADQGLR